MEIVKIPVNGMTFHCRIDGDKENEMVVLLHGFPESSLMWRKLMSNLSEKGFFCVAPDLRGYSPEACPKGKKNYQLDALINDVKQIAETFSKSPFHLIGHDWGAAIGWKFVYDHPSKIQSWTGMSVPHLQSFGHAIFNDPKQMKMSSYIRAFQWPWLPEMKIRKKDFAIFRRLWKYHDEDEIDNYLNIFRNGKQLTAALNFYRANYSLLKSAGQKEIMGAVSCPTLFIWGAKDPAIGRTAVSNGHDLCKGPYEFVELDTGHWLMQTSFDEVNEAIMKHLNTYKVANRFEQNNHE